MEGYVSCKGVLQLGRACMEGCNICMVGSHVCTVGSYIYMEWSCICMGVSNLYSEVLHL